jgi:hypothetical protein
MIADLEVGVPKRVAEEGASFWSKGFRRSRKAGVCGASALGLKRAGEELGACSKLAGACAAPNCSVQI